MIRRAFGITALAAVTALALVKPHILHTKVCRMNTDGTCPLVLCTYSGVDGMRRVFFDHGAAPAFCWPVRFFAFDRPQP